MDLTAFLAARLDEDERHWRVGVEEGTHGDTPWRVERDGRELAAKRNILTRCEMVLAAFDDRENGAWPDVTRRERSHARKTLDDLAIVYSDHEDFDPAWKD